MSDVISKARVRDEKIGSELPTSQKADKSHKPLRFTAVDRRAVGCLAANGVAIYIHARQEIHVVVVNCAMMVDF